MCYKNVRNKQFNEENVFTTTTLELQKESMFRIKLSHQLEWDKLKDVQFPMRMMHFGVHGILIV